MIVSFTELDLVYARSNGLSCGSPFAFVATAFLNQE